MVQEAVKTPTICVVGLGYVGYPLIEAFARHFPTIGFDRYVKNIESIQNSKSAISATTSPPSIKQADYIMICVPTPVLKNKQPDLNTG
jgi:UDPglucose 6-dehydrogenase/UDP-N-acetyl-D-galactosamine dehydrogenase